MTVVEPWPDFCVLMRASAAAYNGDLEALTAAYDRATAAGRSLPMTTVLMAAMSGSLPCLMFLNKHGVRWHPETTAACATNGDTACIEYALKNGAPWHIGATLWAAAYARNDSTEMLRFCHEHGARWHPRTLAAATFNGNLECLRYAHGAGAPWRRGVTNAAASHWDDKCLRYCHQQGAKWDPETTAEAAFNGNLACLQYAHVNGAPWDYHTMHNAAFSGHLDCLRYAVQHGAPRHPWVLSTCVRKIVLANPRRYNEWGTHCGWGFCDAAPDRKELMLYAMDVGLPYEATALPNPYEHGSDMHNLHAAGVAQLRGWDLCILRDTRLYLHKVRLVQRAWRARKVLFTHTRAVRVIEAAYVEYMCRPDTGAAFKRARTSFQMATANTAYNVRA